jgi:uncharacterized membrane protein
MASQKQARAASGSRTGQGQGGQGQGGQGARNQGARDQGSRGQAGGRPQDSRSRSGNSQNGKPQNGRGPGNRGQGSGPGNRPGAGRGGASAQTRARIQAAEPLAADRSQAAPYAPAWLRWTTLVLSLAGLGVSIYLTIAHYSSSSILVCPDKGLVNCAKVTTSPESMVFGVFPVAVLGLAFYVFMVAVNTPWAWRLKLPLLWWARLGSAVVGIGFVLYLVYVEVIQIGNICLWCTSVHVITFLLFALLVFAASMGTPATARAAR